jgi:hypothetical protein
MSDGALGARLHAAPPERPVTVTDDELAEAVRADLVAMVSILHEPPIGEVHLEDGATWFRTGQPSPYSNGVLQADLPRDDLDAAIERRLARFRSPELPIVWWRFVPPEDPDPGIEAALRRHGLVLDTDRPGFGSSSRNCALPRLRTEP